jgi:hypothetical protein
VKTVKVRIKSTGLGLLLHNPAGMGASNGGKKVIPTPEQEAKAACYYVEDGETLAIPAGTYSGTEPCRAKHRLVRKALP